MQWEVSGAGDRATFNFALMQDRTPPLFSNPVCTVLKYKMLFAS